MPHRTPLVRTAALALTLALLALAALGGLQAGLFDRALMPEPGPPLDFSALVRTTNDYLVAPDGFTPSKSDGEAPVLGVSAEKLKQNWEAMLIRQPEIQKIGQSPDGMQIDYIQWSAFPRLPDLITVRFIPMPSDPETGDYATVAVYDRPAYGLGDVDTRKARVTKWLYGL